MISLWKISRQMEDILFICLSAQPRISAHPEGRKLISAQPWISDDSFYNVTIQLFRRLVLSSFCDINFLFDQFVWLSHNSLVSQSMLAPRAINELPPCLFGTPANFTNTAEIHARSLTNFYGQYADRHMNLKFKRRVREREWAIRQFVILKNKLMSVCNVSVLLLTMNFVITLSK